MIQAYLPFFTSLERLIEFNNLHDEKYWKNRKAVSNNIETIWIEQQPLKELILD